MMLAYVLKTGAAARVAALSFTYSVTAFMLNVCYLRDSNDKHYLSKAKAQEYMKEQIAKQTNVKGGMLDHYIRTGAALYDRLIGAGGKPTSVGAGIVSVASKAENTQDGITDIVDAIDKLVEKNIGAQSFRELSASLGFKSFTPKATRQTPQEVAQAAVKSITNVVQKAEKARTEGKAGAPTERQVVQSVAQVVASPLELAKAAIDRYSKLDTAKVEDLEDLVKFCNKVLDVLIAREEKKPKAPRAVVVARKSKATKARASV
jgi:hypothetical protein